MADRITEQVQSLFDSKAPSWSGKYAPDGRLAGRLAELAGAVHDQVAEGGQLVDLGCGTGELARHLATAGYQVTGCDIASQMLSYAAAADPDGAVSWILLDPGWHMLPLATGSMDAVVAASVLEYVAQPSDVLRESARVLRPGGVLLCTVPDPAHPVRWLEWLLGQAARVPLARSAASAFPRLEPYLTYLRVSRHRRRAHWWYRAARQAGLQPIVSPASRAPLRLLAFTRPGNRAQP